MPDLGPAVSPMVNVLPLVVDDLQQDRHRHDELFTVQFSAEPADEGDYGVYGVVHRKRFSVFRVGLVTTPITPKPLSSSLAPIDPAISPPCQGSLLTFPKGGEQILDQNAFRYSRIAA